MFLQNVGIDSFGVHIPSRILNINQLLEYRIKDDLNLSKMKGVCKGLGVEGMAVPEVYEDTITMATQAALESIRNGKINPAKIKRIIGCTETSYDKSKPYTAQIHSLLGLPYDCLIKEEKHACLSGVLSVIEAVEALHSGISLRNDEKILLVFSDIAKYAALSPEEITQGAGAAALIMSRNPRVANYALTQKNHTKLREQPIFDAGFGGNIPDFFRPDNSEIAHVYGSYSENSNYLTQLNSFRLFKQNRLDELNGISDVDYFIFHTPFAKMARKNFSSIMLDEILKSDTLQKKILSMGIEAYGEKEKTNVALGRSMLSKYDLGYSDIGKNTINLGVEENNSKLAFTKYDIDDICRFDKMIRVLAEKKRFFEGEFPSIKSGNSYTVSWALRMIHTLESECKNIGGAIHGRNFYIGGYGSGGAARSIMFNVANNAQHFLNGIETIEDRIEKSKTLSPKEYELLGQTPNPQCSGYKIENHVKLRNATIRAHQDNDYTIQNMVCTKCLMLLPGIEGLNICPKHGKTTIKKTYPTLGTTDSFDDSADSLQVLVSKNLTEGRTVQARFALTRIDEHGYRSYGVIYETL